MANNKNDVKSVVGQLELLIKEFEGDHEEFYSDVEMVLREFDEKVQNFFRKARVKMIQNKSDKSRISIVPDLRLCLKRFDSDYEMFFEEVKNLVRTHEIHIQYMVQRLGLAGVKRQLG